MKRKSKSLTQRVFQIKSIMQQKKLPICKKSNKKNNVVERKKQMKFLSRSKRLNAKFRDKNVNLVLK